MEVYVHEIIMKSHEYDDHIRHLEEIFFLLKKYNMK